MNGKSWLNESISWSPLVERNSHIHSSKFFWDVFPIILSRLNPTKVFVSSFMLINFTNRETDEFLFLFFSFIYCSFFPFVSAWLSDTIRFFDRIGIGWLVTNLKNQEKGFNYGINISTGLEKSLKFGKKLKFYRSP